MPDGTVVPSGGALPFWLENSTIVPLFSPLETCLMRAAWRRQREAGLPHEKSSSFSLTNAMFFSCSQADERSSGLGSKTRAKLWENVCLKRRKEDFREAMRLAKAGCHPKTRQDVAVHVFAHINTVSLLAVSLPGCHQAACDRPAQRRSIRGSGRRGSNPRQPAWKAVRHEIAVRSSSIGSASASSTHIFISHTIDIVCCLRY